MTMDQYAGSPGHSTYCYTELAVSSPAVAETIADRETDNQRPQCLWRCGPTYWTGGGRQQLANQSVKDN